MTEEELKEENKAIAIKLHQDWLKKYKYQGQQGKANFRTRTPYVAGGAEKLRTHEDYYPGAQDMARKAGAGGWRAFTQAGRDYRKNIRSQMPWLGTKLPASSGGPEGPPTTYVYEGQLSPEFIGGDYDPNRKYTSDDWKLYLMNLWERAGIKPPFSF